MDETSFSRETPESSPPTTFQTEKRWILFFYVPSFLIVTTTFGMFFDERSSLVRAVDFVSAIGLNIFAFAWCRIDSRERSYELHRFFSYVVVVFGILATVYYLFRSRGFKGGLVAVGWWLLYSILLILVVAIIGSVIIMLLVIFGVASPPVLN